MPLVSYVLLRGRCRNCKEPISARYPAVEVTTGLLFGAAAYEFGASLALLPALVLVSALIPLAVIDLEHRLLPNAIVGPAALQDSYSRFWPTRRAGGRTRSPP